MVRIARSMGNDTQQFRGECFFFIFTDCHVKWLVQDMMIINET
jgi:hypothetical protein